MFFQFKNGESTFKQIDQYFDLLDKKTARFTGVPVIFAGSVSTLFPHDVFPS